MNMSAPAVEPSRTELLPVEDDDGTLSVPVAGKRYFDLSERSAYQAAARGEIPTVRVGNLLRVPKLAVRTMFIELGKRAAERAQQTSATAGRQPESVAA